jgi:hypothetical protein
VCVAVTPLDNTYQIFYDIKLLQELPHRATSRVITRVSPQVTHLLPAHRQSYQRLLGLSETPFTDQRMFLAAEFCSEYPNSTLTAANMVYLVHCGLR